MERSIVLRILCILRGNADGILQRYFKTHHYRYIMQ
jgi:hypothetical protein